MTDTMKYCGAALCALMAVLALKGDKSGFSLYISIGASVIFLGSAVTLFLPIFKYISALAESTSLEGYLSTLTKALGITVCVQTVSEICRDCGESALASKLELVGKAQILLLAMPLVGELISLASRIMEI